MSTMIDTPFIQKVSNLVSEPSFAAFGAFGGYYFRSSAFKQLLDRDAAKAISAKGKYVVSVWESGEPINVDYFTLSQAEADAGCALKCAEAAGQPTHTPIYVAVDYDASQSDIVSIMAYMAKFQSMLKDSGYLLGVYGSGSVCQEAFLRGLTSYTWLSGSHGWSGYEDWKAHAQILQGGASKIAGIAIDYDSTNGSAGGWQV